MKSFSEETRRKMSESAKRRCSDPEWLKTQYARGTKLDLDKVAEMYLSGNTQAEIADALGVSQKVVWRFMKRNDLTARIAAKRNQDGRNNAAWKGGVSIDPNGYIEILQKDHPRAKKNSGYVKEHILAAEKQLGRYLKPNEIVHHIDFDKHNNSSENLWVCESRKLHSEAHWSFSAILPELLKKGIVHFDRNDGMYKLS